MHAKWPPCSLSALPSASIIRTHAPPQHTDNRSHLGQLTSEKLQIRRRRLGPGFRHRKRVVRERTHAQRDTDQILLFGVELGVHLMPYVVVIAQHARHDAGRGEEVQRERGADVVDVGLAVERGGPDGRVGQLVVLLADEHHDADGVVVEGYADGLRARAHLDGVPHVAFVQVLAHPPFGAVHGGLLFGVHFVRGWRRARAHVGVHRFAGRVAAGAQFADDPVAPVAGLRGV